MENLNVIGILGVGLSGLGFLLMYMAYKLIDKIIDSSNSHTHVIPTIHWYMGACFAMTITVGVFTFINTKYKQEEVSLLAGELNNQQSAFEILASAQQNSILSDSISQNIASGDNFTQFVDEQRVVLEELASQVASSDNPESNQIRMHASTVMVISDSLSSPNITETEKKNLRDSFTKINKEISTLSRDIAIRKQVPRTAGN